MRSRSWLQKYEQAKSKRRKFATGDAGITLLELMLGLLLTTLLAVGIFQLLQLGLNSVNYNQRSASNFGFTTSLARVFTGDVKTASTVTIASDGADTVKLLALGTSNPYCTSLSGKITTGDTPATAFSRIKPLATISTGHSVSIRTAVASPSVITYTTNTPIDFKVGQYVSIDGLAPDALNIPIARAISAVPSSSSFQVANSAGVTDVQTLNPASAVVQSVDTATSTLNLNNSQSVGNGMVITKSIGVIDATGTNYIVSKINYGTPTANSTPGSFVISPAPTASVLTGLVGATLSFAPVENGAATAQSLVGYELRASSDQTTSTLWRIQCLAPNLAPIVGNSIAFRENLPPINTETPAATTTKCVTNGGSPLLLSDENWSDWSCSFRCLEYQNNLSTNGGQNIFSTCPLDAPFSLGDSSFFSNVAPCPPSPASCTAADIWLVNSDNSSSGAQAGMSVEFLDNSTIFENITSVDLTDPTGETHLKVACYTSATNNTQSTITTCPTPTNGVGSNVVIGNSIYSGFLSIATDPTLLTPIPNQLVVSDASKVLQGMFAVVGGVQNVVTSASATTGSQLVTFLSAPCTITTCPTVLRFSNISGLALSIPDGVTSTGATNPAQSGQFILGTQ